MGKPRRQSTFKERIEARKVFFDTEDIAKAAEAVGHKKATVAGWAKRDDWQGELDKIYDRAKVNLLDRCTELKAAQEREKLRSLDYAVCARLNTLLIHAMEKFSKKVTDPSYDIERADLRMLIECRNEALELTYKANGVIGGENQGQEQQGVTVTVNNVTPEDRHAIIVSAIASPPTVDAEMISTEK